MYCVKTLTRMQSKLALIALHSWPVSPSTYHLREPDRVVLALVPVHALTLRYIHSLVTCPASLLAVHCE